MARMCVGGGGLLDLAEYNKSFWRELRKMSPVAADSAPLVLMLVTS